MNRYLATPLILLLGATALTASAQDRGYGRERSDDARAERGAQRGADNDRESRQASRDKSGSREAPDRGVEYGRGDAQRGGQPNAALRASGGAGRVDPGVSGFGYDSRPHYDRQDGGNQNNRRSNDRYTNAYGAQDYRRGVPRTNQRDYGPDFRDGGHYDDYYRYSSPARHWHDAGWRQSWNHGWGGNRYRASSHYYYPRGYAARSWSIGYHLPLAFLAASYYVDYRPYGLAAPPYGCRWVRVDSDLLLVEIDGGEIVDILYGFYY